MIKHPVTWDCFIPAMRFSLFAGCFMGRWFCYQIVYIIDQPFNCSALYLLKINQLVKQSPYCLVPQNSFARLPTFSGREKNQ